MAQTGEPNPARISRRSLLAAMAAAPAVGFAADPDAALVTAWRDLRALEHDIDHTPGDVPPEQNERLSRLEHLIARTPCYGATGLRVKVEMLAHLYETAGVTAEWELDLCRTILTHLDA